MTPRFMRSPYKPNQRIAADVVGDAAIRVSCRAVHARLITSSVTARGVRPMLGPFTPCTMWIAPRPPGVSG